MVTTLEFLPVRRRYEGYGYAVSTSVPVRFGPGEDEQVFRLLSWPVFAPVGVELRKGVVRHAPSPLGPRVGHDGDVLLNVDCVFAELFNCQKLSVKIENAKMTIQRRNQYRMMIKFNRLIRRP